MPLFKSIRVLILLIILISVLSTLHLQRNVSRDWSGSLDVVIIPVAADSESNTRQHVAKLGVDDFDNVSRYLKAQAKRYDQDLSYGLTLSLGSTVAQLPPAQPKGGASYPDVMLWALKLRWWAWRNQPDNYHDTQIRLYVLYQSPEKNQRLPHSTGIQNGLIGLINARAFEKYRTLTNVIVVHELLHILGANDKYDLVSGKPLYPNGFANPDKQPLYPQRAAEIMGRAIPLSDTKFNVAIKLGQTMIGKKTAQEIGWLEP